MTDIRTRLRAVRQRIESACEAAGRAPDTVSLLAVSKTFPPEVVAEAAAAGQRSFGENYLQDALPKILALEDLRLDWHFIGQLQSNKTRDVAERFSWAHSVDRLKIARRLSEQRSAHGPELQICLQVALDETAGRGGVPDAQLDELAEQVAALPRIRLRGLMAIPPADAGEVENRRAFARVRGMQERLVRRGHELDTLSMGMSGDLEAAIAEGATLVRIGSAIFGDRPAKRASTAAAEED